MEIRCIASAQDVGKGECQGKFQMPLNLHRCEGCEAYQAACGRLAQAADRSGRDGVKRYPRDRHPYHTLMVAGARFQDLLCRRRAIDASTLRANGWARLVLILRRIRRNQRLFAAIGYYLRYCVNARVRAALRDGATVDADGTEAYRRQRSSEGSGAATADAADPVGAEISRRS